MTDKCCEWNSSSEYCCWLCAWLYGHNSPSSNGCFQQDNAPGHKAKVISSWFHEHDNEFIELQWPPQSPDQNPIEHLLDVRLFWVHGEALLSVLFLIKSSVECITTLWSSFGEHVSKHLPIPTFRRRKETFNTKMLCRAEENCRVVIRYGFITTSNPAHITHSFERLSKMVPNENDFMTSHHKIVYKNLVLKSYNRSHTE